MQLQSTFNHSTIVSPELDEVSHPHGEVRASVLDNVIIAVLVLAATLSFIYGNSQIRLVPLICALMIGIVKPQLLVFALSMASSLDVDQKIIFTPMRAVIVFTGIALLVRIKDVAANITKDYVIAVAYCLLFALWSLLCSSMRVDLDGVVNALIICAYATICVMMFIIVHPKFSIPTFIWLGLAPTVISSILSFMHLGIVQKYAYLVTPEGSRYRGILNDPNYLSSILVVGFTSCIVCLNTKKGILNKVIYLAISAAFFVALWLTQSRGGIYSGGICLSLLILWRVGFDIIHVKLGNLLIMPLVGVLVVIFLFNSTQSRIFHTAQREGLTMVRDYTREGLMETIENPVFGLGEANFVKRYGVAPHNTMISIGLEYGIIGMCLMLVGIFYGFVNLWRYRRKGAAIFFFPFLALNIVLCSFSGPGHKLFWFYLAAAAVFHERALYDNETNLAPPGE